MVTEKSKVRTGDKGKPFKQLSSNEVRSSPKIVKFDPYFPVKPLEYNLIRNSIKEGGEWPHKPKRYFSGKGVSS